MFKLFALLLTKIRAAGDEYTTSAPHNCSEIGADGILVMFVVIGALIAVTLWILSISSKRRP